MSLAHDSGCGPHTPQSVAQVFNFQVQLIGFLRWKMAFMVIFSHAGSSIAGFYGGEDLTQISKEQSIGGVAVASFLGFLITRFAHGRATTWRYMWRRVLRIFRLLDGPASHGSTRADRLPAHLFHNIPAAYTFGHRVTAHVL